MLHPWELERSLEPFETTGRFFFSLHLKITISLNLTSTETSWDLSFFLSFHYNVFPKKFTSHIQRDITSPKNTYVFPSLLLFFFTPKKKERQILIFFYLHIIQIRPIVRIVLISDQSGQHGAVGSEGRSNECQHVGIPQFTVPCSVDRSWIATLEPGEGGPETQRIQHQTDRLEGHWKKMERD